MILGSSAADKEEYHAGICTCKWVTNMKNLCWSSADQNERLGGVLAIDELIDVKVREQHLNFFSPKCSFPPQNKALGLDGW